MGSEIVNTCKFSMTKYRVQSRFQRWVHASRKIVSLQIVNSISKLTGLQKIRIERQLREGYERLCVIKEMKASGKPGKALVGN